MPMIRWPFVTLLGSTLAMLVAIAVPAQTSAGSDASLLGQGRALVTAGDCAGCHGEDLRGGAAVNSPMGPIYASNITPDGRSGIGGWTLAQFRAVMRSGEAPDHHLYPAMPYTSFTGLSDPQIAAMYAYLMHGVRPVSNQVKRTDLPFPFVRSAMIGWNAMFLKEGRSRGAVPVSGPQLLRGRELVEALGHCSACHTPRGALMQELDDRHLGGGMEGGWWAPNITPDPSGIGRWSDQRVAKFLTTGHTDVAVAADDMGLAVSRSLSKLPASDIAAIIAYLRAVPPVSTPIPQRSAALRDRPIRAAEIEPASDTGWRKMVAHDTVDGAVLYQSACAACHGADGGGSAGLRHPSLRLVNGVVAPAGATLVHAIAVGVDRKAGGIHAFMPGFRDSFDDDQIAALANYVRMRFGGVESDIGEAEVRSILDGTMGTPWPIRHALALSIVGIVAVVGLTVLLGWWIIRRQRARATR